MTDIHQGDERIAYFNLYGASFSIIGDYDAAITNLHVARAMLLQIDLVNPDHITHPAINKTLDDGTYIECRRADGNKSVTIITPSEEVPRGEIVEALEEEEERVEDDLLIPLVKLYDGIYGTAVGWAVFYDGVLDTHKVLFLSWDFDAEPDPLLLTTVDIGVNLVRLAQLIGDMRNGASDGARCENMLQGSEVLTSGIGTSYNYDTEDVIKDPWDYPPMPYMESEEQFILMRDFDDLHADRLECEEGLPAPESGWVSSFDWYRNRDQNLINRQGGAYEENRNLPSTLWKSRTYYTGFHMLYDITEYYLSYTLNDESTPGSQRLTDPDWTYYSPNHRFDWDTFGTSYWKEGYSNDTDKEMSLVGAFFDTSIEIQEYNESEFHMNVNGTPSANCSGDLSFACLLYDLSQVNNARLIYKYRNDWYCERAPMYWGYVNEVHNISEGVVPCSSYAVDVWPDVSYQHVLKLAFYCRLGNDILAFDTSFELTDTEKDSNYVLGWEGLRFVRSYANHLFRTGRDAEYEDYAEFVPRQKLATIGDIALYLYRNNCPGDVDGSDYGALFFFNEEKGIAEEVNPSVMTYFIEEEERASLSINYPHIIIDKKKYHFQQTADQHHDGEYYPENVNDHCNKYGTTQRFVARFTQ